ncbi:hypothetical protein ACWC1D_27550 [Streptomyces sp. NPDC001478]
MTVSLEGSARRRAEVRLVAANLSIGPIVRSALAAEAPSGAATTVLHSATFPYFDEIACRDMVDRIVARGVRRFGLQA